MSLIRLNTHPSRGQLRLFGVLALIFLGVVGALAWHRAAPGAAAVWWTAGGVVAAAGLIEPRVLRPVYLAAVIVSFPLGLVSSYLILGAVYYLVLTPVGLMMRLAGHDPLTRRFEAGRTTYWKSRDAARAAASYLRQQ
jgi:hypothetical protein